MSSIDAGDDLMSECSELIGRVAYKRSCYPQSCAKYVSKALQCEIDQLVTALKPDAPVSEADNWEMTDKFTEDSPKQFEKLKSLNHFNKINQNLQEAKEVLKVLDQISREPSCEIRI